MSKNLDKKSFDTHEFNSSGMTPVVHRVKPRVFYPF